MIESALFVALNVLDTSLTYSVLKRGGKELNPLMRWLMGEFGVGAALIVAKVALVAAILALDIGDFLWALNAFYAAVVINNYNVLRKQGQRHV